MRKLKYKYILYYKKFYGDNWLLSGKYTKTDVIGTANNFLKIGYLVKIYPIKQGENK